MGHSEKIKWLQIKADVKRLNKEEDGSKPNETELFDQSWSFQSSEISLQSSLDYNYTALGFVGVCLGL